VLSWTGKYRVSEGLRLVYGSCKNSDGLGLVKG
jgi:hypothetical protein